MEEGEIQVDSIEPIGFPDITPELARESGFLGVLDLLEVAKHGRGEVSRLFNPVSLRATAWQANTSAPESHRVAD